MTFCIAFYDSYLFKDVTLTSCPFTSFICILCTVTVPDGFQNDLLPFLKNFYVSACFYERDPGKCRFKFLS
jgi:hypothetical protein